MAADARLLAARPDLADARLEGRVEAQRFVQATPMRVAWPVADMFGSPERRSVTTQLLLGETFEVLETAGDLAWGRAARDGYVGHVAAAALEPPGAPATHRISTLLAHLYPAPSVRAPVLATLPYGAHVSVTGEETRFAAVPGGFVPLHQLMPTQALETDPVAVAERFIGLPYLWGGRSPFGIDCSGLVQTAFHACGRECPRDSDQQEAALGTHLPEGAALRRGDLVFWKGHVGLMQDGERLLHANGHHMAVVSEPLPEAEARILAAGSGPVTARKRP